MRGVGMLACLQVAMGLDEIADGRLFAYLLLTHPPAWRGAETAEGIERDLRDLGTRLGLSPETSNEVPHIGTTLALLRGLVLLDLGDKYLKLGRPGSDWATHLEAGGPVVVIVGLDLAQLHNEADVDAYITQAAVTQRAMVGIAHGRKTTAATAPAGLCRPRAKEPGMANLIRHAGGAPTIERALPRRRPAL
jgi:hypothetical protein